MLNSCGGMSPRGALTADEVLGMVARNFRSGLVGFQDSWGHDRLRMLNWEDPGAFLEFLAGASHFAISLDSPRPQFAGPSEEGTRFWGCLSD